MKNSIPILLLASTLLACQQGKQQSDTRQTLNFEAARSNFFNGLVNPSEVARQLQTVAPQFRPDLLSDPKMFSHYASNEVKAAANLGIYIADLNYAIAYSQSALVKEYFEASYELSRAAGMEKSMLEFLKTRYEANLSKNDSVKAVVDDLLARSTRGFQGTQRERQAGIAMAAYQIENLHLALALLQLQTNLHGEIPAPVASMIMNQRRNVETTYNFIKAYSDPLDANRNPNYPYYANALLELIDVYSKVDAPITRDMTDQLSEKVEVIRNMILKIG